MHGRFQWLLWLAWVALGCGRGDATPSEQPGEVKRREIASLPAVGEYLPPLDSGELSVAPPAHATAPSYVALGDSYSSGVGTRTYLNDGTSCQRSVYAFPSLIAAAKGYALNFRACSGAKVSDVTNTQLSALSSSDERQCQFEG